MKTSVIICSGLLLIGWLGLKQQMDNNNTAQNKIPTGFKQTWFKKTRKELLRDVQRPNPFREAVGNSMHFMLSGSPVKSLLF